MHTANQHLVGVEKGMDNNVRFGRTMMQALQLVRLAKRHVLG